MNDVKYERLVVFVYLLMRDCLPAGEVCKIITNIGETERIVINEAEGITNFKFSNQHLENLARDYANRICND